MSVAYVVEAEWKPNEWRPFTITDDEADACAMLPMIRESTQRPARVQLYERCRPSGPRRRFVSTIPEVDQWRAVLQFFAHMRVVEPPQEHSLSVLDVRDIRDGRDTTIAYARNETLADELNQVFERIRGLLNG